MNAQADFLLDLASGGAILNIKRLKNEYAFSFADACNLGLVLVF